MEKEIEILSIVSEELREQYIKQLPELLIRLEALRRIKNQFNAEENVIKEMVNVIGEHTSEYYEIQKKVEKSTHIDYSLLNESLNELKNELPNLGEEQLKAYSDILESLKTDIEVKAPAKKLKLLSTISEEKANKCQFIKEKESFKIIPNAEALNELIEEKLGTIVKNKDDFTYQA
ncbi:MAG: hypothetical protein FWE36_08445 [Erysipelotrichales bacterium]|nr:hypothetical protein [Erysipelotrichales bacterium]